MCAVPRPRSLAIGVAGGYKAEANGLVTVGATPSNEFNCLFRKLLFLIFCRRSSNIKRAECLT